jgi:hypothetical protein
MLIMSIYTKQGSRIREIDIDKDCYFGRELVQIRATVEGESGKRLLYISDLREDGKNEIRDAVRSTMKTGRTECDAPEGGPGVE